MTGKQRSTRRSPRIDYPRRGRRGVRRWLPSWRQVLAVCAMFLGGLAGLFAWAYAYVDIPDEKAAARQEATVYYWADGSQMVSVGAVNRQNVPLSQVPVSVRNAVIAAENESFYTDSGVSPLGIVRGVWNTLTGEEAQGGSTITQQYVKNTYLSQEQTLKRKVEEFFIALKLDNRETKDDILQGYLNTSWFGRGSFGIQAAADAYYGIPAKDLNPSQAAALAALLKGADLYDPATGAAHHKRAVARWKWILDREVDTGLMSRAERDRYRVFPEPKEPKPPTSRSGQTGYLVDVADKYLKSRTGLTDRDLARGGYRIHTTFEKDKVAHLAKAVNDVRRQSIDPRKRPADKDVQFGAASVRASDGAVLALYGGPDATRHFSNNADTAGVPAGSAFKPFVLAAALQEGPPRQGDTVGAVPMPAGPAPLDALQEGIVTSEHAAFVSTGKRIGLKRVRDLAIATGLRKESMAPLEQTFPIGTSTPSAIRLAGAYTTFTHGGRRAEPYSVTEVVRDGERLPGFAKPEVRRVLDPEVADAVTRTLRAYAWKTVPPQAGPELLKRTAAGGTGEHDRMRSAWFIGDDGERTTAVTMFRNKPGTPGLLPLSGVGGPHSQRGGTFPPRVWAAYEKALRAG
ncbi:transglycosylase domain-containing protein [Streptomyces sp. NPDC003077]|uniref:transglycosylase domain-containing protein n=1 Tax=Streptomyces sp. NPDC003077 TaxID=3154443 RepID=UPI0033B86E48